jgi:hypothetical protein
MIGLCSRPGAPARRISVVGASGSGKTYLARALAERLGLPHCELDRLRWDTAGQERSPQEFIELVALTVAQDKWIIDGHYRLVRHQIWQRAEIVVWLNYPLPVVAIRLLNRFSRKRLASLPRRSAPAGGTTAALPFHRPAAVTWKRRLSRLLRTVAERADYARLLRGPGVSPLVIELSSVRATNQWLDDLDRASEPASMPCDDDPAANLSILSR